MFFNIECKKTCYINDINKELINCYINLRDNPKDIMKEIDKINSIEFTQERYNHFRNLYNQKIKDNELDILTTALFITLNKYCFNGLYRVNKNGFFNVPWNKKNFTNIYDKNNILSVSKKLKSAKITTGDFADILTNVQAKDFVFLDSPYAPLNSTSFDAYTKTGFLKEDHIRLSNEFKRLNELGCYIMLTNHNTELIRELYKDFNIKHVSVKRLINSDSKNRVGKEIIITNY